MCGAYKGEPLVERRWIFDFLCAHIFSFLLYVELFVQPCRSSWGKPQSLELHSIRLAWNSLEVSLKFSYHICEILNFSAKEYLMQYHPLGNGLCNCPFLLQHSKTMYCTQKISDSPASKPYCFPILLLIWVTLHRSLGFASRKCFFGLFDAQYFPTRGK